jgi:peptidoglycan hydrolase-like protein with peptidoglycan-binding domain
MQFQEAVQILIGQLAQQRITQGGKFVTIDQYVYQEEVIKRMKSTLKSRGLYSGNVDDGQYDEKLKAAVKRFQKGIKQQETGAPDQGTLYELFKPQK